MAEVVRESDRKEPVEQGSAVPAAPALPASVVPLALAPRAARLDPAARARVVRRLQQTHGNATVARAVADAPAATVPRGREAVARMYPGLAERIPADQLAVVEAYLAQFAATGLDEDRPERGQSPAFKTIVIP